MWEGFLHTATLNYKGQTYTRSFSDCTNACKAIYTNYTGNQLTNGSAEVAGTYNLHDGPGYITKPGITGAEVAHIERVTTWVYHGMYSFKLTTAGCTDQAGVSLTSTTACVANATMRVRGCIKIINGNAVNVYVRSMTSPYAIFWSYMTDTANGEYPFDDTFEMPSSVAGNICMEVRIQDEDEVYIDGCSVEESGTRNETSWYYDTDSVAAYGTIERILLEAGNTSAAAISRVQRVLANDAWMWPHPAESGSEVSTDAAQAVMRNGLQLAFAGYITTLPWRNYAITGGVAAASTHITNLIGASEFVTAGTIDTNALSTYVEASEATRVWDAIEEIIRKGTTAGASWVGGCYAGRVFNYNARPTTIDYIIRDGQWYTADGNMIDVALVQPGFVRDETLPYMPISVSSTSDARDDARVFYMDSVEFIAPNKVVPHFEGLI